MTSALDLRAATFESELDRYVHEVIQPRVMSIQFLNESGWEMCLELYLDFAENFHFKLPPMLHVLLGECSASLEFHLFSDS